MEITRRKFIQSVFALAAGSVMPTLARASLPVAARKLQFHNIHTGESLKTIYWEQGQYNRQALKEIAHVLRDHRTGDIHPIDPRLLDLLVDLRNRVDSSKPFEVISGYRSPKSNAMLHEHTSGVAVNSLHMSGQAIDIRLADRSLTTLRDTALAMQGGGVGFYPASDFIHMDTGNIRHW